MLRFLVFLDQMAQRGRRERKEVLDCLGQRVQVDEEEKKVAVVMLDQ